MRGYLQATLKECRKALASHNTGLHARATAHRARTFMGETACRCTPKFSAGPLEPQSLFQNAPRITIYLTISNMVNALFPKEVEVFPKEGEANKQRIVKRKRSSRSTCHKGRVAIKERADYGRFRKMFAAFGISTLTPSRPPRSNRRPKHVFYSSTAYTVHSPV